MDAFFQWLREKRLAEAQHFREEALAASENPNDQDTPRPPGETTARRLEALGFITSVAVAPVPSLAAAGAVPSALGVFTWSLGIL